MNVRIFVVNGLLLISFFASLSIHGQQSDHYIIDGQIEGVKDGEKVVMLLWYDFPNNERRDSAIVKNGKFHISGHVPEGPRSYRLVFETHRPVKNLLLYIDNNQQISIQSNKNIDSVSNFDLLNRYMLINGSATNQDYWAIRSASDLYLYSIRRINDYISDLDKNGDFDKSRISSFLKSKEILNYTLLNNIFLGVSINSSIPYLMNGIRFWGNRSTIFKSVYDSLVARHVKIGGSYYGEKLKKAAALCEGQSIPLFSLPTIDGKVLALKDVFGKSKLTLINFWGWNSYRVENYHRELLNVYNNYKDKGLNIIGVYSDTSAKKWRIIASELPWFHVSDLKGQNGVVETIYGELAGKATTNVLIDSKGRIIAWDVNGPFLRYYLEKYLGE